MITAEQIADSLTSSLLIMLVAGEQRPVHGLELVEAGGGASPHGGDLVVVLGMRDAAELRDFVPAVGGCAGLVARSRLASDPEVRKACASHGLPLIALADGAGLSVTLALLRDVIEHAVRMETAGAAGIAPSSVYPDLYAMADVFGDLLDAPVTVEDERSRVLAYSVGQYGVDDARTSTIIGRRVPREVRDHFRALGVFRRLANSDEPVFVPPGRNAVKARLVIPVRAGGEWLGSVWAVVETEPPADVLDRARAAAEVLALHLLRLRALDELHRGMEREQVRALLRGEAGAAGAVGAELPSGPWRVIALGGPDPDLDAEERITVWAALCRRQGWRSPVLGDLEGVVHAVVAGAGSAPGSWAWLRPIVEAEARAYAAVLAAAGGVASAPADLVASAAQARELTLLADSFDRPVLDIVTDWAPVVRARAVRGVAAGPLLSPLAALAGQDEADGGSLLPTLCAVLDHWGEPQRAARALGVHVNTVRNRMARLDRDHGFDLEDPIVRLALRLEAAVLESHGP